MTIETKFNLFDVLRDTVSGFKGQVLGVSRYATGCTHYGLAPMCLDKDGKVMPWEWLDEHRLVLAKKSRVQPDQHPTGGLDRNPRCK